MHCRRSRSAWFQQRVCQRVRPLEICGHRNGIGSRHHSHVIFRPPPDAVVPGLRAVAGSARAIRPVRIRRRRARSSAKASRFRPVPTPGGRRRRSGRIHRSGTDRSTRRASCRIPRRGALPGRHSRRLRRIRPEDVRRACRRWGRKRSRIASHENIVSSKAALVKHKMIKIENTCAALV